MFQINVLCYIALFVVGDILATAEDENGLSAAEGPHLRTKRGAGTFTKYWILSPLICKNQGKLRQRRAASGSSIQTKHIGMFQAIYCKQINAWLEGARHFRPRDCEDIKSKYGGDDGIYKIYPATSPKGFNVFCDMRGGGWTVIQRRMDGSVDFYRTWTDYKHGFGHLSGEYWLGNENTHHITKQGMYRVRFDLEDYSRVKKYAQYDKFFVGNEANKYKLTLGKYSAGNAGDSFGYHNGMMFSTKDSDNDRSGGRCTNNHRAGFWFNACCRVNVNGQYLHGHQRNNFGLMWQTWHGFKYSLKYTMMKLKRQ